MAVIIDLQNKQAKNFLLGAIDNLGVEAFARETYAAIPIAEPGDIIVTDRHDHADQDIHNIHKRKALYVGVLRDDNPIENLQGADATVKTTREKQGTAILAEVKRLLEAQAKD